MCPQKKLIDAAFYLIAQHGWQKFSLPMLASHLEWELTDLQKILPSKIDFFKIWQRFLADEIKKELPQEDLLSLSQKDRLLELSLLRFDMMTPHKQALKILFFETLKTPKSLCLAQKSLQHTWEELWIYAGLPTTSFISRLQLKLFMGLYLYIAVQWLNNALEGEALQATLDQHLTRGEATMSLYS